MGLGCHSFPCPSCPKGALMPYLRHSGVRPLTAPLVEMERLRAAVQEGFPRSQRGLVALDSGPPGTEGLSPPSPPSA